MKTNFNKQHYFVHKKAIAPDAADFVYKYFLLKRRVAETLFARKYISPYSTEWGYWKDPQTPNTYAHYADIVMETLLVKLLPAVEKITSLNLYPNYSYARIYKNGDILERHKDRFSCEISATLHLGGDKWPIYAEPSGKRGLKGIKIDLKPGDLMVYPGREIEHWREKFKGRNHAQAFLHYSNKKSPRSKENLFDGRPHLGLPDTFRKTHNND